MSAKRLVLHDSEGVVVPDICGTAIEIINPESAGSTKVSFAKLIIRPGEESRQHYHRVMEEIYYIISGTGRLTIDDKTFEVGPGHAIFLPTGSHHQITNTGEGDLVFVCADAPVFDENDVFEA
jgi:mannose-6-phosphate isomerase-like protein (cupin superfamily)